MTALEMAQMTQQYASAGANAAAAGNNLLDSLGINFGHSPWYNALKVGEAQNQVNQQMAQWNMGEGLGRNSHVLTDLQQR